jgi:Ca2+-binding RTX toxin-like protein
MTTFNVPNEFASILDAMIAASPGDTINLGQGYGPEAVDVMVSDITITGPDTATGIELTIGAGVTGLTLGGDAPINVIDSGTDDTITGNDGDNTITVTGGIGDTVDGGAGDDRLVVDYSSSTGVVTATTTTFTGSPGTVGIAAGSIEHFTVLTGDGVDTITLTTADGNNYIDTGEGASTVVVGHGDNVIVGGSGIETLTFGDGNNTIDAGYGTIGANTLTGGSGNNTILGSDGIDTIALGGGNNRIVAGDGANTITVGPTFSGNNVIIAGSGIDTITVGGGNNCIDAGVGTVGANTITAGPTFFGNNSILGSDGIDTIVTGHGNDYIAAGGGANTITAGSGNDLITAGDAIDTITAMGGNNVIEAGDIGVNTVTTGVGNDVVETGGGADVIATGAGDDIIKDAGGAGSIAAGAGHDRLVYDFSASTAPVTNTVIDVAGTASGVMGATTYAGIEEFHITGGSGADNITTGAGADVLDGGDGADTLIAGEGSDVIYGGVGDVITGGEDPDGNDHDVLVLNGLGGEGAGSFAYDVAGNTENGTFTLNSGGSISFTGIESVVFEATTISTLEDTPLVGPVATLGATVATFEVGNITYTAGDTAFRTEGELTIEADGSYIFTPAPNYNGPAPVINYTDSVGVTSPLFIDVTAVDEMTPHCFTGEAPIVTITEDANNDGQIDDAELSGLINVQIALPGGAFAGDLLKITNPDGTTTDVVLTVEQINAGEVLVEFYAPAAGQTITVSADVTSEVGTSGTGTDAASMVVCFVRGTLIATADGDIPVEDLKVGDLVETLDHGPQPLRWVGQRHLDARELTDNANLRPIRIRKNVVCAEKGVGDLVVSPQHRILVASKVAQRMFGNTEVLVPAKQLLAIEGVEIADDLEDVTYFHILFDQHEIVYANGVPSESLYLGHMALRSLTPAGREEIHALFPEVASPTFMPTLCRPIVPNKRARQLAQRLASNGKPLLDAQSAHYQPKMLGGVAA